MKTITERAHELHHFFMDEVNICGCGNPESAAVLLRDILRLCPLYDHRAEFEKFLPDRGVQHFILGVLSECDVIEHGGGIGGSWLTDKGKMLLGELNALSETDPELGVIFPGMEAPPKSCKKCYP